MAKERKQRNTNISFTPFLYIGFILVCATALLDSFIPGFPGIVRNLLYVFGVMFMVVYMLQIASEKRTGKRENDVPATKNSGKNGK